MVRSEQIKSAQKIVMMENKCNKTPNKYLEHVYCHGEGKSYMRSNNSAGCGGSAGADVLALLKENKQLKAMLILHLDLIQEQSDQLIAKDKQIFNLKEELQVVQTQNVQFENTIQDFQRQLQLQIKRANAPSGELALLSPPPLAKIQCKKDAVSGSPTNIGKCNGKLITIISDITSEEVATTLKPDVHDNNQGDNYALASAKVNDASLEISPKEHCVTGMSGFSELLGRGAKPRPPLSSVTNNVSLTMPSSSATVSTVSRGKQMPLMLWHAPNMNSEDSGSCDESTADIDQELCADFSPSLDSKFEPPETPKKKVRKISKSPAVWHQNQQQKLFAQKLKRRCFYITTKQMYASREWEDGDDNVCDYEFNRAEAGALHTEVPMLEIPKWTEHELSPSYCIEGTEDLSDESFLKRHAKLESDEKRRKKWDVQQIREQRRIEKLKLRHCKSETQNTEIQVVKSFYPQPDSIQSIYFINELPVQAFGEIVPKINTNGLFSLPWLQNGTGLTSEKLTSSLESTSGNPMTTTASVDITTNITGCSSSVQAQTQMKKSSYIFLKKRKKQQNLIPGGIAKQRTSVVGKSNHQTVTVPTVSLVPIVNSSTESIVSEFHDAYDNLRQ